jgi:hypothetical protein
MKNLNVYSALIQAMKSSVEPHDVRFAAYLPVLASSSGRCSFLLRRIYIKDILVGREHSLPPISHLFTLLYFILREHYPYLLPLQNLPIISHQIQILVKPHMLMRAFEGDKKHGHREKR